MKTVYKRAVCEYVHNMYNIMYTYIYRAYYYMSKYTAVKTSIYVGLPRCRTTIRICILIHYVYTYYTFVSDRVLWSGDTFIYHLHITRRKIIDRLPVSALKPLTDLIHVICHMYIYIHKWTKDRSPYKYYFGYVQHAMVGAPTLEKWPSSLSSYRFPSGSEIPKGSKTSCSRDRYTKRTCTRSYYNNIIGERYIFEYTTTLPL